MSVLKNIMILADDIDTGYMALTKAKDLLSVSETQVHLIRALNKQSVVGGILGFLKKSTSKESDFRKQAGKTYLYELKNRIREADKNFIIDASYEIKKKETNLLNNYLLVNQIDLVIFSEENILGNSRNSSSGNMFRFLPRLPSIQVIYFLKEIINTNNRILLIPIFGLFSEKKINQALDIARKFNAHIHIVTILDDQQPNNVITRMDAFYLTYKAFSDFGHRPQYKIISQKQTEDILLSYAKRIKSTMIYLRSDESKDFKNSMGNSTKKIEYPVSELQVLTLKMHEF